MAAMDDADVEYPTPPDTPRGSASDNEYYPTWLAMKFDLEIQVHVLSGHSDANTSISYTFGRGQDDYTMGNVFAQVKKCVQRQTGRDQGYQYVGVFLMLRAKRCT